MTKVIVWFFDNPLDVTEDYVNQICAHLPDCIRVFALNIIFVSQSKINILLLNLGICNEKGY